MPYHSHLQASLRHWLRAQAPTWQQMLCQPREAPLFAKPLLSALSIPVFALEAHRAGSCSPKTGADAATHH